MYTPGASIFPHRIVEEYRWKVRHNFKQYMYLGLKRGRWEQDRILKEIWNASGYVAYKIIKYSSWWSHIYVKFQTDIAASEAVDYFRNLDGNLNAELVDNLLCSWYLYENLTGCIGQFTAAAVDAVGDPPQCMDPMLEPILATVLADFGAPRVLVVRDNAAQVVFTSMAEALGACIAHGKWLTNLRFSHLYYRVKIIGTGKELAIIGKYLSQDNVPTTGVREAFKLDYFADPEELRNSPIRDYLNQFSHNREVRCAIPRQPIGGRQDRRHRRIVNNATSKDYLNRPRASSPAMFLNSHVGSIGVPNNVHTMVFNDFGAPLGTMVFRNSYGSGAPLNVSYSAIPTIVQETDYSCNEDLINSPFINEQYSYEYFNSFEVASDTTSQFSSGIGNNYNLATRRAEPARVEIEFDTTVPKEPDVSAVVFSEVGVCNANPPAVPEIVISRSCPRSSRSKITASSKKVTGTAAEHCPPAVRSRDTEIPNRCPQASMRTEFRNSKRTSTCPPNRRGYRRK